MFAVEIVLYTHMFLLATAAALYLRWRNRAYWRLALAFAVSGAVCATELALRTGFGLDPSAAASGRLAAALAALYGTAQLLFPKSGHAHRALAVALAVAAVLAGSAAAVPGLRFLPDAAGFAGAVYVVARGGKTLQADRLHLLTTGCFGLYFLLHGAGGLSALAEGASAYVPAIGHLPDYVLTAAYFLLHLAVLARLLNLMQAVTYTSTTDGLTGLYNRRHFARLAEAAVREDNAYGAIFLDIDNFKRLNDTQGHEAGDAQLQAAASILLEETASIGFAGRYGGEETAAIVTDPECAAEQLAERIRSRIAEETAVTVSVGVRYYEPGATAGQLIQEADAAMYEAKRAGKNKVVMFGH